MTHPWLNLGIFAIDTLIIVIAILVIVGGILLLFSAGKLKSGSRIKVSKLNEQYAELRATLQSETLSKKALKAEKKKQKKASKPTKRLFVINFTGDIKASAVNSLSEQVTMLLTTATPKDEILVRLESPGGMVQNYGLAASQLQRIRDKNIPLTIAADKVAASGGYLMACVANKIIAAPFAVIGSIGVVIQTPNFHRWLQKNNIDFEQLTAGKHKRNLTVFGKNTEEDREKTQEIIDDIHQLFIEFIKENRPQVDTTKVATGEFWFGKRAIDLKLVDELKTSDDYLMQASKDTNIIEITAVKKKKMMERFFGSARAEVKKLVASDSIIT